MFFGDASSTYAARARPDDETVVVVSRRCTINFRLRPTLGMTSEHTWSSRGTQMTPGQAPPTRYSQPGTARELQHPSLSFQLAPALMSKQFQFKLVLLGQCQVYADIC